MNETVSDNTSLVGFTSKPYRKAEVRSRDHNTRSTCRNDKKRSGAGYLLVRLGICAVCFGAVLALKLKGDTEALAVIGSVTELSSERPSTDSIGRLKFVDLPSIIEVFAPSKANLLPVESGSFMTDDEGITLRLESVPGSNVISPAAGRVLRVGSDDIHGPYVVVLTSEDIEFELYGVDSIAVEAGQPVAQRQVLGKLSGSELTVRIFKSGRPVPPTDIFTS
ncbi:MAG: M23 family metallopeptidase, partial [Clostridia bacterium]|nr:M23 family metallopeptidase [Clostridia bacterium]